MEYGGYIYLLARLCGYVYYYFTYYLQLQRSFHLQSDAPSTVVFWQHANLTLNMDTTAGISLPLCRLQNRRESRGYSSILNAFPISGLDWQHSSI